MCAHCCFDGGADQLLLDCLIAVGEGVELHRAGGGGAVEDRDELLEGEAAAGAEGVEVACDAVAEVLLQFGGKGCVVRVDPSGLPVCATNGLHGADE